MIQNGFSSVDYKFMNRDMVAEEIDFVKMPVFSEEEEDNDDDLDDYFGPDSWENSCVGYWVV